MTSESLVRPSRFRAGPVILAAAAVITLAVLLSVTSATSVSDGATEYHTGSWTSGNCTVTLADGTITVTGHGAMRDYKEDNLPGWAQYKGEVTSIVIGDGVEVVGYHSFYGFDEATRLTVSSDTKSIGREAFMNCSGLSDVTISDSVKSLGDYTFSGCTHLKILRIKGVTSIGSYTFSGCTALDVVGYSPDLQSIGKFAFYGCITLGAQTMPDSLTSLGEGAFEGCKNMGAFYGKGLTSIGNGVFQDCSDLINVYLSDNVTSIQKNAFLNCKLTGHFYLPPSLEYIGTGAFALSELTSVVIPDSVSFIDGQAFASNESLENVTLGSGLKTLGKYAFANCSSLKNIILNPGLESIKEGAFQGCTALESVDFGGAVSIAKGAFKGCDSLKSVVLGEKTENVANDAFPECKNHAVTIYLNLGDGGTDFSTVPFENAQNALVICGVGCSVSGGHLGTGTGTLDFDTGGADVVLNTRPDMSGTFYRLGDTYTFTGCSFLYVFPLPLVWDSGGCQVTLSADMAVTVTGSGDMADYSASSPAPWSRISDRIVSVSIGEGVTGIGAYAFRGCGMLTSVTVGSGVQSFGTAAFGDCWGLFTVYYNSATAPDLASGVWPTMKSYMGLPSLKMPWPVLFIHGNGGHVAGSALKAAYSLSGATVVLEGIQTGEGFTGFSTSQGGHGGHLAMGDSVTISGPTVLYAQYDSASANGNGYNAQSGSASTFTLDYDGMAVNISNTTYADGSSVTVSYCQAGDAAFVVTASSVPGSDAEFRAQLIVMSSSLESVDMAAAMAALAAVKDSVSAVGCPAALVFVSDDGCARFTLGEYAGSFSSATLSSSYGAFTLDSAALAAIGTDSEIAIGLSPVDSSQLSGILGRVTDGLNVVQVTVSGVSGNVSELSGGATLVLPYASADGGNVSIYCLGADGSLESLECTCSDGIATAELDHLSYYLAGPSGMTGIVKEDRGTLVLAVMVLVTLQALALLAMVRRRQL